MTPSEVQKKIAIAAAGIDRFYDEGFTIWSEEKFRVLFAGASLEEDEVQRALTIWQEAGAIRLKREKTCFVEVLHPIT